MMVGISAASRAVVPTPVRPKTGTDPDPIQVASNDALSENDFLFPLEKALLQEFKSVDNKQCGVADLA